MVQLEIELVQFPAEMQHFSHIFLRKQMIIIIIE